LVHQVLAEGMRNRDGYTFPHNAFDTGEFRKSAATHIARIQNNREVDALAAQIVSAALAS
jgi:hypothetical protein